MMTRISVLEIKRHSTVDFDSLSWTFVTLLTFNTLPWAGEMPLAVQNPCSKRGQEFHS